MSLENTNEYFPLFYTNSGQNNRFVDHRNVSKDIAGCSNNYYMYMFQKDDSAWSHHKLSKILYCTIFTILYLILSHRIWSYYQSYHQDMILIHSCKTSNCLLGPCNPFFPEMNWHEKKNQYNTINVHNFTYQSKNNF